MIALIFPALNHLDRLAGLVLPLAVRIMVWGAFCGVAATVVYLRASRQGEIRSLKERSRELRRRLLDASLGREEYFRLTRENLGTSLRLLRFTLGPALLSLLPVVPFVLWLDTYHAFTPPGDGASVPVATVPPGATIRALPPGDRGAAAGGAVARVDGGAPALRLLLGDRTVYEGDPWNPPAPSIRKKSRWNLLVASPAGYLAPDAPLEEVRLALPRLDVFSGVAGRFGWEYPFFAALTLVAVVLRVRWRVQ